MGSGISLDLFDVRSMLSEEELMTQKTVERFVDEKFLPIIQECFDGHRFPLDLVPELANLGLFGITIKGYGCAGRDNMCSGLIAQELERGDSGLRSFVSVQGSLVMHPIHTFGSDEQKDKWLPRLACAEAIGCFGLTESQGSLLYTSDAADE